ncbi:hypothetical protein QE152_g30327 [Popillia japonica]|uniref:DDE-1 domain-containing protein n=1 Tax=Popillia japonica TaxID=7064 RepID=A0AAW1JFD9_POPJA
MKSLNVKDAIHTCAQAWNELKDTTLQKSWKKICPSLYQDQDIPEANESDTADLVTVMQSLQRDIQPADVEERLAEDNVAAVSLEEMADDQIIALVLEQAGNEEDAEEEEDEKEKETISHFAAKDAFESALQYLEQQSTAISVDILRVKVKKWCDAAAMSRFKKL